MTPGPENRPAVPPEVPFAVKGSVYVSSDGAEIEVKLVSGDTVLFSHTKPGQHPMIRTLRIGAFEALVTTGEEPDANLIPQPAPPPGEIMTPDEVQAAIAEAEEDSRFYDSFTKEQLSRLSVMWDEAHGLAPWWEREKEYNQLAETKKRLKRWTIALVIVGVVCAGFLERYRSEAQQAKEKLNWIYQDGAKDPAVRSLLEKVDRERTEYYQSLKDDQDANQ